MPPVTKDQSNQLLNEFIKLESELRKNPSIPKSFELVSALIGELKLPKIEPRLELPSREVHKEQNPTSITSDIKDLDKSKLAKVESAHFIVYAANSEQANSIGLNAEKWLTDLNKEWFGSKPIRLPIKAELVANVDATLGAGGSTRFNKTLGGYIYEIQSKVQGSPELLADSVIPHEISHMLVATNFRNPLIRWADEGIAVSMECQAEKQKLKDIVSSDMRGVKQGLASSLETFNGILVRTEYPEDKITLLKFYAKSASLTEFLIDRGGKNRFIEFLQEANSNQTNLKHWNNLLNKYYKLDGSFELEVTWRMWEAARMKD